MSPLVFLTGNHIGQPAGRNRVMHAMERVHHLLEIRPRHQCHVDAAVQVPPGDSQVSCPIQPRANRPFIAPCNVGTRLAGDSDSRARLYMVHRSQRGLVVARSEVDTGD
jgi:hypothetical protein